MKFDTHLRTPHLTNIHGLWADANSVPNPSMLRLVGVTLRRDTETSMKGVDSNQIDGRER